MKKLETIKITAKETEDGAEFYCPFSGKNTLEAEWEENMHEVEELVYYDVNLADEPSKMSEEIQELYEDFIEKDGDKFDFLEHLEKKLNPNDYFSIIAYYPNGVQGDFVAMIYKTNNLH
jgi:hypothetical protein